MFCFARRQSQFRIGYRESGGAVEQVQGREGNPFEPAGPEVGGGQPPVLAEQIGEAQESDHDPGFSTMQARRGPTRGPLRAGQPASPTAGGVGESRRSDGVCQSGEKEDDPGRPVIKIGTVGCRVVTADLGICALGPVKR
jgi:hypothetical protein